MRPNPVKEIRKQFKLTLQQAAEEAGVHPQAFFLQEQGAYPELLPTIMEWLEERTTAEHLQNVLRYHEYQTEKRQESGLKYGLSEYEFGAPAEKTHPFIQFRTDLGLSRLGFAKAFCIHPGVLYRLEKNQAKGLSKQVEVALREAGMSSWQIKELRYRIEEWNGIQ